MRVSNCVLLFFTSLLIFFPTISFSINTLTATNSVTNDQTLISSGDIFELGFFSSRSSDKWYVGIWYKNIPERTYVWVANRDNPLSNSFGVFKVADQNIVLLDQNQKLVWSSNITKGSNTAAMLLDSGNLVLREAEDPNNYLWQSFDFPTDTLLPDMKLGWDLNRDFDRYLTSWRSPADPSSGDFSFKLDYRGFPEIFLWDNKKIEYRSGPWNGVRFSGTPEMKPLDYIQFKFVTSQDEVTYSFSVTTNNLFSRLIVNPNGVLQRLTWIPDSKQWNPFWYAPKDQCDNYRECGPYGICDTNASPVCKCPKGFEPRNLQAWNLRDASDGCMRKTNLECMGDKFLHLRNVKLPETTSAFVDQHISLKDCGDLCLRNCSCTAYANADIRKGGTGCVIWFGELLDIREYPSGGQNLSVRLAASDLVMDGENQEEDEEQNPTKMERSKKYKTSENFDPDARRDSPRDTSLETPLRSIANRGEPQELPLFDFDSIVVATNNFRMANKLGQGGYGPVYKGKLHDGTDVAVKRLSSSSGQGIEEFKNEVRLISKLQHRNLVRLIGCCVEREERLLIYEFLVNKSLDNFLFDPSPTKRAELSWAERFNIVHGIARGLLYLHRDSSLRVIHRDLKVSNILLDEKMNPKISDFGLARIFEGTQYLAKTHKVVGTLGYMSPEYGLAGIFSEKSDVFSFGVLLLEIVSGKKVTRFLYNDEYLSLLAHAWQLWNKGKELDLIDEALADSFSSTEVKRCIQVALLCVQDRAENRPTMAAVISMLSSETELLQPKEPTFTFHSPSKFDQPNDNTPSSVCEITMSLAGGR
ncbi:hypothetical protein SLEP1_g29469 [Rubroshorea leprosula]|uniref:Receptor-like serine/threonine-protein kinase n=1 Tax=Rubroshorea leprosula TaxID=152421 RepID=A0AAV5K629_9ROSI|nr:hypothetical protein SLEP1_g29469 [Rubroshorea leprosula]